MKVLIYLAAWRRPEITEICFKGINRLRSRLPLEALCVISEHSMIALCERYGIRWTFFENNPLGAKKNHGLNEAMKLDWDYLIEIGSDDLLKNEVIDLYQPYFGRAEYFGMKKLVYLDTTTGACRYYNSDTIFGLGRCMSRAMLERVCHGVDIEAKEDLFVVGRSTPKGKRGFFPVKLAEELQKLGRLDIVGEPRYRLWADHINSGMDNNSDFFLAKQGVQYVTVKTDKPLSIDLKSKENLWAYNGKIGERYPLEKALEGLSEAEVSAIYSLIKKQAATPNIEYANFAK